MVMANVCLQMKTVKGDGQCKSPDEDSPMEMAIFSLQMKTVSWGWPVLKTVEQSSPVEVPWGLPVLVSR